MFIGNTSVVKIEGQTIVLVTTVNPPAREKERVDISALADTREQAALGREKQYEFSMMLHWKPADTYHAALLTQYEAETEVDVVIEFTKANRKWTINNCKIQKLGFEQVAANETLKREVVLFTNETIAEAVISA